MDLGDVFVFVVDSNVLLKHLLSEQAAYPLQERAWLIMEEFDVFVSLFVYEQRHIHFEIVGQFVEKFVHFFILIILSVL